MKLQSKVFKNKNERSFHFFNPRITWSELLLTSLGTMLGIGLLAFFTSYTKLIFLVPPFGASAVLLYAAPTVALAQPRNVIGGHILSALVSVAFYQAFGNAWWVITLAVTAAIIAMALTDTLHPPGGATAVLAMITGASWSFVIMPIGLGAILMVLVAIFSNRFSENRKYPTKN